MKVNKASPGWMLSLIFTMGALGAAAWADQTPAEDAADPQEPYTLDWDEYVKVNVPYVPTSNTIVTKLSTPLRLTPAIVGAVSGPLLREQSAVVLGDSLRNISGLNVQTGSGVFDFFIMRGFDSLSSGLVMTDGVPEPEASFYSMYNAEGVEVLKGPGGYLYGSNPLAGVVNIVRKQPIPNDFFHFKGTLGSHDTLRGVLDWNQAGESGESSFRLNGLWQESDHYRDDKESSYSAINPSFAWRLSESTSLNFNFEYVNAEFSPDSGLPLLDGEIPDVPRTRSYQSPFDFSEQTLYRFQSNFETVISESLTLRNKLYYRDLDWATNGTLLNGIFPGTSEVIRTVTLLDDRQKFIGNQFEAVMRLQAGPVTHELLAGLELAYMADRFTLEGAFLPNIDLFDPVETATQLNPFPIDLLDPAIPARADARSVVMSPYVIDQMNLPGPFQLLLGARYDNIDYEDSVNSVSRDDSKLSPMVGLVYALDDNLSLYGNAGKSFAPASPRAPGNREPEESTQFELGAKKRFLEGKVRTTVAVYQLDRENIAIPDDNGISQQVGDQRSRGFELEIAAEPGHRFRTFFSYAYTDAELTSFTERLIVGLDPITFQPIFATLDRAGNRPAFAPEHLANLWVSKTFRGGFGMGGGARFMDGQFIAEDNLFEIESALVLDATVFYNFPGWRLNLSFKNLTDAEYETRGFGSTSVIPADPFSVYAGFEYRF